ncbi:MAG TPA: hypothetical protein VEU08_10445 [Vicinamibacterales bacterium]|nr:hypothetical protein [Vicinamibacterales bacterium]
MITLPGIFALATLTGCSNNQMSTAPEPTVLNLAGTWNGAMTINGTTGGMTLALTQTGTALTGPLIISLSSGVVLLNGTFTGSLTGSSLAGTIAVTPGGIPVYPSCTGQLSTTMTVTLGTVSTLSGPVSLVSSTCNVPFTTSTVTLTRS